MTFNRIRLNFFWAMAYNVVMLPVAAGVLYPCIHMQIPPWVAGKLHPIWLSAYCCLQHADLWLQLLQARGRCLADSLHLWQSTKHKPFVS